MKRKVVANQRIAEHVLEESQVAHKGCFSLQGLHPSKYAAKVPLRHSYAKYCPNSPEVAGNSNCALQLRTFGPISSVRRL